MKPIMHIENMAKLINYLYRITELRSRMPAFKALM